MTQNRTKGLGECIIPTGKKQGICASKSANPPQKVIKTSLISPIEKSGSTQCSSDADCQKIGGKKCITKIGQHSGKCDFGSFPESSDEHVIVKRRIRCFVDLHCKAVGASGTCKYAKSTDKWGYCS